MHTNFTAMLPALRVVRNVWPGVLGAYPDHGQFKMPKWVFEEVDAEQSKAYFEAWVSECRVSLIGGCCGLGPDFIQSVAQFANGRARQASSTGPASNL